MDSGGGGGSGWFQRVEVQTVVSLWPSALADVRTRIRRQLDSLLMRYSTTLGGVPVAYTNPRARTRTAAIHEDSPLVHVDLTAEFTVFAPKPNMRLHGTVNKITPDHVGILVLGVFNASLPRDALHPNFEYDPETDTWAEPGFDSPSLGVGSQVAFNVVSIESANGIVSLVGEMKSENTGPIAPDTDKGNPPTVRVTDKSHKVDKKLKRQKTEDEEEQAAAAPEVGDVEASKEKKKKKKHKKDHTEE